MAANSWLCLHFPQLAIDQLQHSCAQHLPLALLCPHKHQVVQLNTLARQAGVRQGMSLATALLLDPQLQLQVYRAELEQEALQRLAEWCYMRVAQVALSAPATLLLNIGDMRRLYASTSDLIAELEEGISALGYRLIPALAHSAEAARILAQAGRRTLAASYAASTQALAQLPLAEAGLSARDAERVQRMGLQRLGPLLALPSAEVKRRLGSAVACHLQQLERTSQAPRWFQPAERFQRQLTLLYECSQSEGLRFPLNRLLQWLCEWLRMRQLSTQQLRLILVFRNGALQVLEVGAAQAESRLDEWLMLCGLRLDSLRLEAPVVALQLHCETLLPLVAETPDLFSQRQLRLSAAQLCSRLQLKLGRQRVLRLCCSADHRPELAGGYGDGVALSSTLRWPRRPQYLLSQPQPLQQSPELTPVDILDGPERIDSGWWDAQPVQRDYYLAQTGDRRRAWIFRDPQGQWFIHGWFT